MFNCSYSSTPTTATTATAAMNQSQHTMESPQQQQMKAPSSLEDRLPPLFECHHATVRYIRAGYYLDAIHSIIEGFSACQSSLLESQERYESSAMLIEMDSPLLGEESNNLVIDRNPMDPCSSNGKSPLELLLLAMHYNLALSYHLFASSAIGDATKDEEEKQSEDDFHFQKEQVPAILGDALHLYEEFSIRMHNLDPSLKSSLHTIPALQSNMRHAKLLQLQFR